MVRIIIYHQMYGCDTGCCGHVFEVSGAGDKDKSDFDFDHPWGKDFRQWAEGMVREYGCDPKDIDWDNCDIQEW